MVSAWELHKKLKSAEFFIIQDSGHSMTENGIIDKLVYATNKFVEL